MTVSSKDACCLSFPICKAASTGVGSGWRENTGAEGFNEQQLPLFHHVEHPFTPLSPPHAGPEAEGEGLGLRRDQGQGAPTRKDAGLPSSQATLIPAVGPQLLAPFPSTELGDAAQRHPLGREEPGHCASPSCHRHLTCVSLKTLAVPEAPGFLITSFFFKAVYFEITLDSQKNDKNS